MDPRLWKNIAKADVYTRKSEFRKHYRLPPISFFHVVIRNTSAKSIEVDSTQLVFGNRLLEPLEDYRITEIYKSPVYDFFDFHSILAYRHLLSPLKNATEINYDKDTTPFIGQQIPPWTTVVKLIAFEWLPVEYSVFTVRFVVSCGDEKKSIDFILNKSEYRSKDHYFDPK